MILLLVFGVVALYRLTSRKKTKSESRHTMVLTLSPIATKSGGPPILQHLSSPPSDASIKLQLEVVPGKFRNYKAELLSEDATLSTDQEMTTELCDGQSIVLSSSPEKF